MLASRRTGWQGPVDLNSAPEKELTALPHMTPAIVKGLLEKRRSRPSWTPTPT
jgi:hypothetical protein